MVHHEVGDDPDAAPVGGVDQRDEVLDGAELRQHLVEVADVVAAVAQRRVVERRQPQAVDAKPFQVIELVDQTAKVARSVGAAVVERPHQHLVEHGTLEPGAVLGDDRGLGEIVGGRMFHHAVFDVAALRGVMLDVFVDAARRIHRTSNLPTRDEIESGQRVATALSKEVRRLLFADPRIHSRHSSVLLAFPQGQPCRRWVSCRRGIPRPWRPGRCPVCPTSVERCRERCPTVGRRRGAHDRRVHQHRDTCDAHRERRSVGVVRHLRSARRCAGAVCLEYGRARPQPCRRPAGQHCRSWRRPPTRTRWRADG